MKDQNDKATEQLLSKFTDVIFSQVFLCQRRLVALSRKGRVQCYSDFNILRKMRHVCQTKKVSFIIKDVIKSLLMFKNWREPSRTLQKNHSSQKTATKVH